MLRILYFGLIHCMNIWLIKVAFMEVFILVNINSNLYGPSPLSIIFAWYILQNNFFNFYCILFSEYFVYLLEAQLLSYYKDVTYSTMWRLVVSHISPLFVIRFGCSLQFCHLELNKEAISDVIMAHSRIIAFLFIWKTL